MITIRAEKPDDVARVRDVNLAAFGQPLEADIVSRIRENCDQAVSLVAVLETEIVGHILFSPVHIEGGSGRLIRGMGLAPMSVLPSHQRQGIGSRLVRTGIDVMKSQSCPFIVVLGHPDYYPRFGFEPASRRDIRCEWDVPDNVFMILALDDHAMTGVSGLARYRSEFSDS